MNILISLSAAIAPAVILVIYFYKQDKAKPEPRGLVLKVFFFGVISTVAAIILELVAGLGKGLFENIPVLFLFFKAFIVAALCEEWVKLMVVKLTAFNNRAFDEVMDGIVYTVVASLGFACLENVLYVLGGGLQVAIMRAFTSIPLHAIASGLMGYYIGKSKFASSPGEAKSLRVKGLLIAIGIHGFYDFVLFAIPVFGIIPALSIFPLLIVCFVVLKKLIKAAIAEDREMGRVA